MMVPGSGATTPQESAFRTSTLDRHAIGETARAQAVQSPADMPLFALAHAASFVTCRVAPALAGG